MTYAVGLAGVGVADAVWAARERLPVATPKPRASDHVLARFRRAL